MIDQDASAVVVLRVAARLTRGQRRLWLCIHRTLALGPRPRGAPGTAGTA